MKGFEQELIRENDKLRAENLKLKYQLEELKRILYGKRSEKHKNLPVKEQLSLFESLAKQLEENEKKLKNSKKQQGSKPANRDNHPGRHPLPKHLRRIEVVIEPEEETTGLPKIGEEITEVLHYIPGELVVKKIIRPKYAKAGNAGVLIGELPERFIDKGIPSNELLTHIVISKFVDHLPLNRINQIFKREGVVIKDNTLGGWIRQVCKQLELLYDCLQKELTKQAYVQADETTIKVLHPKNNIQTGYFWGYSAPLDDFIYFQYHPGRSKEYPVEILSQCQGVIQTDGYEAYQQFKNQKENNLAHCWAHVRRKYDNALKENKALASEALVKIQLLYKVEALAKEQNLNHDKRLELREKEALPIIQAFKQWLDEIALLVVKGSLMATAINYTLKLWKGLTIYLHDGRIEIDNNRIESAIRPIAIGRKNFLFAGSPDAAKNCAMMYSFMGTCKINDINPNEWLSHVLNKIKDCKASKLKEMLPQNWKNNKS